METGCGDAAAAAWTFRGDESRRRRHSAEAGARRRYLQGNSIDDATAVRLAPALAGAGIEEVYLGKNKIADEGGVALAAFARSEHGPRKLSLYGNQLGDAAAASFADAIAADPILELLNLSHNAIGDTGAGRLSEGLGTNSRLRKLDVAVDGGAERRRGDGVAATPRPRRGDVVETESRRQVAGTTPRPRRGYSAETSRGRDVEMS